MRGAESGQDGSTAMTGAADVTEVHSVIIGVIDLQVTVRMIDPVVTAETADPLVNAGSRKIYRQKVLT
jgi:hypothetical protein